MDDTSTPVVANPALVAQVLDAAKAAPIAQPEPTVGVPQVLVDPAQPYGVQLPTVAPSVTPPVSTDKIVNDYPEYVAPQPLAQPVMEGAPILSAQDIDALSMPTEQQVSSKIDSLTSPLRESRATALALDSLGNLQRKSEERLQQLQQATDERLNELNNNVRERSLNNILQSGSLGEKFGAALAVLAGGIGSALRGQAGNPVIDYFDKIAEQQARKDKLTQDEREALRMNLYRQGQVELQKMEQATNNAYRKDSIKLQYAALKQQEDNIRLKLSEKLQQQVADSSKWSGKALRPEQEAGLKIEERRNIVTLPNGSRVLTQSYEDANKFKEKASEIYNALGTIDELKEIAKKGSKFSLEDRARANSMITKIVGALRLPYTGPGVMTDSEREVLIKTLGSPLAIFSLRSVENAKLDQVAKDLQANLASEAKLRGINERVVPTKFFNVNGRAVPEDELIKAYQAKMPNMSPDRIKMAIQKTLPEI